MIKPMAAAVLLLIATACNSENAVVPNNSIDQSEVRKRVKTVVQQYRNPAFSVGIIIDGELVFNRDYGTVSLEEPASVGADAVYQVGSITKIIVALLAVIQWQEGLVDLDAPITSYDANLKFSGELKNTPISLRQLLTHTAGLPPNAPNRRNIAPPINLPSGFDPTISRPYSVQDLYEGVTLSELEFTPGSAHSYCNFCFDLAGYLLAHIGGFPTLAYALQEKVFTPLGMANTGIGLSAEQRHKLVMPYSYVAEPQLYGEQYRGRYNFRVPPWDIGEVAGALGMASTVSDLARMIHLFSLSDTGQNSILKRDALALLFKGDHEYLRKHRSPFMQSLGWRSNIFGDYGRIYRHTGNNDGHNSFIAFSRIHRHGVIVLGSGAFDGVELLGNRLLLYVLHQTVGKRDVRLLPSQ